MHKAIRFIVHFALLLGLPMAAGNVAAQEAKLSIAFVTPITGSDAGLGKSLSGAAEAAVTSINETGVYGARPIDVDIVDVGCGSEESVIAASRLVAQHLETGVPEIVIGHCPGVAADVAPIYAEAGLPLILPLAVVDPEFPIYDYGSVFQLEPGPAELGRLIADALGSELPQVRRLATLGDGSSFSRQVSESIAASRKERGNQTIVADSTIGNAADLEKFLTNESPEMLIVTYENASALEPFLDTITDSGIETIVPRRAITTKREWRAFVTEASEAHAPIIVFTFFPDHSRFEAPAGDIFWDLRWDGYPPEPVDALVLAAFELSARAFSIDMANSMRSQDYETTLGRLRSGETGLVRSLDWTFIDVQGLFPGDALGLSPNEDGGDGEGGADENPVYNLEIDPIDSADPLVLRADTTTQLAFDVGRPNPASVLRNADLAAHDVIRDAREPLSLTITLTCQVCDANEIQRAPVVYDPAVGESTTSAKFRITPRADRVDADTGLGKLFFSIDANGVDLDVIAVDVFLQTPSAVQLQHYSPPSVRRMDQQASEKTVPPDVVIDISAVVGKLPVTITPKLEALRQAIAETLNETDAESWTFESGVSASDLEGLVGIAYRDMRSLVNQNEDALQRIYPRILSAGAANLDLDEADRKSIMTTVRRNGYRIYRRLFRRGSRGLSDAMRAIEGFQLPEGRPLRLKIRATDVYAPWQILYPDNSAEISAEKFWGFRYNLGTLQIADAAQQRQTIRTVMKTPSAAETIFASWRGGVEPPDEVAERATILAEHLDGKVEGDLNLADSRDEFLNRIGVDGLRTLLIVAHGHASSGAAVMSGPADRPILVTSAEGARFEFAPEGDYIVPDDLEEFRPGMAGEDMPLFTSQPIAILNACETSGVTIGPLNNNGFVGALTRSGARAIVVTDAPVWNNFAYHFGRHLIDELFNGEEIQVAMRNVRLRHLQDWNNPLGLIYSLYGNPSARIVIDDD